METIIRIGYTRELTIRAVGSTVRDLNSLTWINRAAAYDDCTVYPIHTIYANPATGKRHIVRTDDGTIVRDLSNYNFEDELDHVHVLVDDEVINMETLETCTYKEWDERRQPPSMQAKINYTEEESVVILTMTNYYGLTTDLPQLHIVCPTNITFYIIGDFIIVDKYSSAIVITPVAHGNLTLELKEVVGNFHIFQVRGNGFNTKPALRIVDYDDE